MPRGAKLDSPEAVAYLSAAILERTRDAPAMVLKGEMFPAAAMGDPNDSIPGNGTGPR